MLKQNVDRKSVIDREIRAIKSQSRWVFPNFKHNLMKYSRIGSPDDKSSIFTFNDNHNDVEDIDLTKENIPSREEVLEVSEILALVYSSKFNLTFGYPTWVSLKIAWWVFLCRMPIFNMTKIRTLKISLVLVWCHWYHYIWQNTVIFFLWRSLWKEHHSL